MSITRGRRWTGVAQPGQPGVPRLMNVALDAADRGFYVFPLWPRTKVPALHGEYDCPGTGPCVDGHRGWEQRATRDPDLISDWWQSLPLNVGIATGRSGLHVVDLDAAHGAPAPEQWAGARHGRDVLARLAEQAAAPYPGDTRIVRTPRGGEHLYFRVPSVPELRNTVARAGWRVDSRGAGGYIVAAGSLVRSGRYRLAQDRTIAPLPDWLLRLLTPPPAVPAALVTDRHGRPAGDVRKQAYLKTVIDTVAAAEPGTRHHVLLRAAFTLGRLVAGNEFSGDEARASLHAAAARWRGFPTRKDIRTIEDGLRAGATSPRNLPG